MKSKELKEKVILFYDVIPMPHSLLLLELLEKEGYIIYYWYIKNLTKLYPWKSLNSKTRFFVFGEEKNSIVKLTKHFIKSDLLIIAGWPTFMHVFIMLAAYFNRKEYAIWSDVPDETSLNRMNRMKSYLLNLANYVFVTGMTGVRLYKEKFNLPQSKLRDFPYLSSEIKDSEIEVINKLRIKKLSESEKVNIFISNRFEKRKGYKTIYDAFRMLSIDEINNFSIKIAGIGSEFDHYEKLFKELNPSIEFLKWVSYDEYLDLMSYTDVFIHASAHEPFGIPPMDAMNRAKLVISSNFVYSCVDRIESGTNGFIFESGNAEQLTNILKLIINDKQIIYRMGVKAQHTSENFTPNYNLKVIRDIFEAK